MFLKLHDFIDNRLSPTLVREIRQLVRNRFIVVMLNLYLLILSVVTLVTITTSSFSGADAGLGAGLYSFQMGFFFFFAFTVVNLYMAVILSQERITNDLMFTTIIKPSGFVLGKLMSGIVLTFLFFCATLPFFTISYMLRGLDLRAIFDSSYYGALVLAFSMALTILVFGRVKTYVQMIGLLILYSFLCIFGLSGLMNIFLFVTFGGGAFFWGALPINIWFWNGFFVISTMCVILSGAICRVAPTNTNRIMPFRIVYTIYLLATLVVAYVFDVTFSASGYFFSVTLFVHYFFFLAFIVISACGRETWGLRLKRTIPKSGLLRLLVFPFYSGAVNGYFWLIGIGAIITWFYWMCCQKTTYGWLLNDEIPFYCVTWALMVYAFSTIAMIVRSRFLRRFFTAEHNWLLALALFGAFYALYFTIRILLYYNASPYDNILLDYDTIGRTMIIATIWSIAATALLIPWTLKRVPHFTPVVAKDELTFEKAKQLCDRMSFGTNFETNVEVVADN
ncbi:MAG: hypothetical protein FWC50_02385 [Planctomycetaceae bacterium]|nr:hypothetical protein [Planctomycetaceae bacterium]